MIRALGELVEALEPLKQNQAIYYDFGYFRPSGIHSYRGFYNQAAIGYALDSNETTVKDLLELCHKGLTKEFYGWKGGDYRYTKETNIWVAEPGEAPGVVIKEVKDFGYRYILCTEMIET